MKYTALALGLLLAAGQAFAATPAPVDVASFVRMQEFKQVRLSPTGEYLAAVMPLDDRDGFVVIRRSDRKITATSQFGQHQYIYGVNWVNSDRVVLSMGSKFSGFDEPIPTGELFAIDSDGKNAENLIGFRVMAMETGTHIKGKRTDPVMAHVIDTLENDDKNILIYTRNIEDSDPLYQVEKLNVYSGNRGRMFKAPVREAEFTTDSNGVVRFAEGEDQVNWSRLYYRAGDDAQWTLVNDQKVTGQIERALGLSADGSTAYLLVRGPKGPGAIVAYDVATGARKELVRDAVADPHEILFDGDVPIGVRYMDGKPRDVFFDPTVPQAKLYKMLASSFGGESPSITSESTDGNQVVVITSSDRNPGDYYLFDKAAKKADLLMSQRGWLAPDAMAEREPVKLTARDGLVLHGYFTRPKGTTGPVPMVVLPHGGPIGQRDDWTFDEEAQLLAAAGYGVLQVNYRGSAGFGRDFQKAGAQQWGGTMQDDLTDATHWAVKQGLADGSRICIYGGSYGAYASLMGAAKEPDLYKCAVGYVGVYDLPRMVTDDASDSRRGKLWLDEWIGSEDALAKTSPNRLADRIKVPVFLAAGGEDYIAPIGQTRMMESALKQAGVPVETLYYDQEGHGFYKQEHRVEYYTRLLAFLNRHLGGALAGGTKTAK